MSRHKLSAQIVIMNFLILSTRALLDVKNDNDHIDDFVQHTIVSEEVISTIVDQHSQLTKESILWN